MKRTPFLRQITALTLAATPNATQQAKAENSSPAEVVKAEDPPHEARRETSGGICGKEGRKIAKQFMEKPGHFLARFGLSLDELQSSERMDDIVERGTTLRTEIDGLLKSYREVGELTEELFEKIQEVAACHSDENRALELIPYGLQLIEKQKNQGDGWRITNSQTHRNDTDIDIGWDF